MPILAHSQILRKIGESAVVPIVRTPDAETALGAVAALLEGGLDCIEITMTVENALRALETAADRYGDRLLLGGGAAPRPGNRARLHAGGSSIPGPARPDPAHDRNGPPLQPRHFSGRADP